MVKNEARMAERQKSILKGALQVILGAITGVGVFLVISIFVTDPVSAHTVGASNMSCASTVPCVEDGVASTVLEPSQ